MRWIGFVCGVLAAGGATAQPNLLDAFEDISAWQARPAEGVTMALGQAPGKTGQALKLDFSFDRGTGYAIAHRELPLSLLANFELAFELSAEAPVNNLEIKLIDASGENVWWVNRRNFDYPRKWTRLRFKRRHFSFAWGPTADTRLREAAALEIVVTAGTGGKGTVLIDDLTLEELPPPEEVSWVESAGEEPLPWRRYDAPRRQELGGLTLSWGEGGAPPRYDIELSDDGETWHTARTVKGSNGGRDDLFLPEAEAQHLRIATREPCSPAPCRLHEVRIRPITFGASLDDFFRTIATEEPRGTFPRSFTEQTYWTVVGADGDHEEALVSEDGLVEVGKGGFSIEPLVRLGGTLVRWSDVATRHALEDGFLPIPSAEWQHGSFLLEVTAFVAGPAERSTLWVRYRLRNLEREPLALTLALALRPFQVDPPWQFLNTPGGVSPIHILDFEAGTALVNRQWRIVPLVPPSGTGATTYDGGSIFEHLAAGALPAAQSVEDPFRFASGALTFDRTLAPGGKEEITVAIPLAADPVGWNAVEVARGTPAAPALVEEVLDQTRLDWYGKLSTLRFEVPPEGQALLNTLKTAVAHILINRDGVALQPGSRSYERSWIRDGALTSSALLRLGIEEPPRAFLEWFAVHQFEDGRVPCCVDQRGADPTPEHDSHGQLIFALGEDFRFRRDRAFLERLWPHVWKAAEAIERLRQERRTAEYETPANERFFGLLPPSISHEGYSAKPMHSYWDDFWALKGLKDAVLLAAALDKSEEVALLAARRDEFRADLLRSLERSLAHHGITYLPGCADLGDFDPTSTTIALSPVDEGAHLPKKALEATFERYVAEAMARRDGTQEWEAYTPYELRAVGALVRLGWRERAHELLTFLLQGQRPAGWNQWAEVVWKELRAPKFIGDMPHTWVASDFIRSFLDLFAYEREADQALVLADGIPLAWLREKKRAGVTELPTPYGKLSYQVRGLGRGLELEIYPGIEIPPGGLVIRWPFAGTPKTVEINDKPVKERGREIVLRALPARVAIND